MHIRDLPQPAGKPVIGHLGRWGTEPLALVHEGADLGPVFRLRLWETAVVGYRPSWNKAVLTDLDTFRSRGGLIRFSPHLNTGVVATDPPRHRPRRSGLAPAFSHRHVSTMSSQIDELVALHLPASGVQFEASLFGRRLVRDILSRLFLGLSSAPPVLERYLQPLDRPLPHPFVPHPVTTNRLRRLLSERLGATDRGPLAGAFVGAGGVEDLRVSLAAGYDTTVHTLAWLLSCLAVESEVQAPADEIVNEVMRLYPAGWMGSRRTSRRVEVDGLDIPAGTLVMYSPYLTHRDPTVWTDPLRFDPTRFAERPGPWDYIPFAGGPRICLGRFLAQATLRSVTTALSSRRVRLHEADVTPRPALTLAPRGPVMVSLEPRR